MAQGHVPWFNPREMDDATVAQLNTGREALLAQLFADIHERIAQPGSFNHWLLTGARGAGKSFFLRLVQVSFALAFQGKARFVLLPEEHRNIYAPHEFLAETRRMLRVDQGDLGAPPAWRVADPDQAWRTSLSDLLAGFEEPLLVIGVENFDQLLEQAFSDDVDGSRLRQLMSNEPRIMLVATAVHGSFDENYDQRLFRQFEHHPIPPWDATDHRDYLSRRAQRNGQQASRRQLAKVEAYSHYTGGNARAAAVLAGAILEQDDPLQAATDLDTAIEKMSDYYRALLDRIPPKTRKLFDALVRGGEPASQTDIARRTGAQQNDIARAFLWLVDQSYVNESRQPGSKAKSYQVRDRLLVQFYRMRSLSPGQRSKLALMAELLADTLAFQEKWQFAQRYADQGHGQEACTLADLALKERGIDPTLLPEALQDTTALCRLGESWLKWEGIPKKQGIAAFEEILRLYPSDESLRLAIEQILPVARAATREELTADELVTLLMGSLSHCPVEQFFILNHLVDPNTSRFQWEELINVFQGEIPRFQEYAVEHPQNAEALRSLQTLGQRLPRTVSLDYLADRSLDDDDLSLKALNKNTAAAYAAEAALSWLNLNEAERASTSLKTCLKAIKAATQAPEFDASALLTTIETLGPQRAHFPTEQQTDLLEWKGMLLEMRSAYLPAYQTHQQAHQECQQQEREYAATSNLERMAWNQGRMGNAAQACSEHRLAYQERLAQNEVSSAAWNLGQIARHTATLEGSDAAWAVLDKDLAQVPKQEIIAIQQLGDAIADTGQRQGIPEAFSLAVGLLHGLAQRPHLPLAGALRGLWIDMVAEAVPHALLRDLLAEWPNLFATDLQPELLALSQLLTAWLDDLDTPAEQRAARREKLDPDLASTLAALAEALPAPARRRLQL